MAERGKKNKETERKMEMKRESGTDKNRTVADNVKLSDVYIHVILHISCINLYSFQKRGSPFFTYST